QRSRLGCGCSTTEIFARRVMLLVNEQMLDLATASAMGLPFCTLWRISAVACHWSAPARPAKPERCLARRDASHTSMRAGIVAALEVSMDAPAAKRRRYAEEQQQEEGAALTQLPSEIVDRICRWLPTSSLVALAGA